MGASIIEVHATISKEDFGPDTSSSLDISQLNDLVKGVRFIDEILNKTSIAISRAGAGSLNDFINYNIPSILIPLPTAKDNHQYFNASILEKENVAIILDQSKNEIEKAKNYIYGFYKNLKDLQEIRYRFDKIRVKNSNSLIYKLITNEK